MEGDDAQLAPLTPTEVQRWIQCRDGDRDDPVLRYRYLTDPVYHARVHIWEAAQRQRKDTDA